MCVYFGFVFAVRSEQEAIAVLQLRESVTLSCISSNNNVYWMVDMMIISTQQDLTIMYENQLSITGGGYTCTDETVNLAVSKFVGFAPVFTEEPARSVEASFNTTLALNCAAAGNPNLTVTWIRVDSLGNTTALPLPSDATVENTDISSQFVNQS